MSLSPEEFARQLDSRATALWSETLIPEGASDSKAFADSLDRFHRDVLARKYAESNNNGKDIRRSLTTSDLHSARRFLEAVFKNKSDTKFSCFRTLRDPTLAVTAVLFQARDVKFGVEDAICRGASVIAKQSTWHKNSKMYALLRKFKGRISLLSLQRILNLVQAILILLNKSANTKTPQGPHRRATHRQGRAPHRQS